jgi:hypothetical protein
MKQKLIPPTEFNVKSCFKISEKRLTNFGANYNQILKELRLLFKKSILISRSQYIIMNFSSNIHEFFVHPH